jgi:hypothetical protein
MSLIAMLHSSSFSDAVVFDARITCAASTSINDDGDVQFRKMQRDSPRSQHCELRAQRVRESIASWPHARMS